MKNLSFFFVLLALTFSVTAQNRTKSPVKAENPELFLTGAVKEISAYEISPNTSSASYRANVTLNLSLENKGSTPIILLQKSLTIYDAFVRNSKNESLAQMSAARSSFALMPKQWEIMKMKWDSPTPPEETTTVLAPGQVLNFETFFQIDIPKVRDPYDFSSFPNKNLTALQELSPAQLVLDCETWSTLSLLKGKKTDEKSKKEFAKSLRTRWKNHGYLLTERINSQPIAINFNSIVLKDQAN